MDIQSLKFDQQASDYLPHLSAEATEAVIRSVHEITSAYGEEFLFRFKARSVAHSQLRNTLCNAESGQKDESDVDVISCRFLSKVQALPITSHNVSFYAQ